MTGLLEHTEERERAERRRYDSIWWAGVLVWIGLVLGAEYFEVLPDIGDTTEMWPWIFLGVGSWSVVLNLYRTASRTAPDPSTWDWTWTVVFVAVAVGSVVDVGAEIVGAAALVLIGLVVLVRAAMRRE